MVKDAKPDHVWKSDLEEFARSKKPTMARGCHPRYGKWKVEYEKIISCPMHVGVVSVTSFFNRSAGPKKVACNCSYHTTTKKVGAPSTPPNNPRIFSIGCLLPKVPDMLKSHDLKDRITWKRQTGYLDLFIFGPMTGVCPHCRSPNIRNKGANSHIKLVWNYGLPYYSLGIDICCVDCGRNIKSIDSRYVETLPKHQRLAMPFIQIGAMVAVDMKLIRMMRMGQCALPICQGAIAMMQAQYQAMKYEYESKAEAAMNLGYEEYLPFPTLPNNWLPKNDKLIRAFIMDYKMHRHDLLRELQTIRSTQSLAIDHQRQCVKRTRQGHMKDEEKGTQSCVINGDHGLVLSFVVVPDVSEHWYGKALNEVCVRQPWFRLSQSPFC